MKNIFKNLILSLLAVLISLLCVGVAAKASAPIASMNSLSDIYNKLAPVWQPTDPNLSLCWSNGNTDGDLGGEAENCFTDNSGETLLALPQPDPNGTTAVGAVEYCAYLNAAGTALNCTDTACTELNAWRLPTPIELMNEVDNEYLPGGNGGATSNLFVPNTGSSGYWSSSLDGAGNALDVYIFSGNSDFESPKTFTNYDAQMFNESVRCISNNIY